MQNFYYALKQFNFSFQLLYCFLFIYNIFILIHLVALLDLLKGMKHQMSGKQLSAMKQWMLQTLR